MPSQKKIHVSYPTFFTLQEKKPPPKKPEGILKGIENVPTSSPKSRRKAKAAKKAEKEVKINDQVDQVRYSHYLVQCSLSVPFFPQYNV